MDTPSKLDSSMAIAGKKFLDALNESYPSWIRKGWALRDSADKPKPAKKSAQ